MLLTYFMILVFWDMTCILVNKLSIKPQGIMFQTITTLPFTVITSNLTHPPVRFFTNFSYATFLTLSIHLSPRLPDSCLTFLKLSKEPHCHPCLTHPDHCTFKFCMVLDFTLFCILSIRLVCTMQKTRFSKWCWHRFTSSEIWNHVNWGNSYQRFSRTRCLHPLSARRPKPQRWKQQAPPQQLTQLCWPENFSLHLYYRVYHLTKHEEIQASLTVVNSHTSHHLFINATDAHRQVTASEKYLLLSKHSTCSTLPKYMSVMEKMSPKFVQNGSHIKSAVLKKQSIVDVYWNTGSAQAEVTKIVFSLDNAVFTLSTNIKQPK